ncbi:phage holin [Alteribacillus iranensis]|uniref:phage holin n=1 Tax=Alteribacillus iranensis TaxID=930128 RepID=UPI000B8718CC|nr:phage holin [Alteribacillus iranensis]
MAYLTAFGKCPLPLSDEDIQQGVSAIVTVIVALWAWFKNNYITKTGKKQREAIKKEGLD